GAGVAARRRAEQAAVVLGRGGGRVLRGREGIGARVGAARVGLTAALATHHGGDQLFDVLGGLPIVEALLPDIGVPADGADGEHLADLRGRVGPLLIAVDHDVPDGLAAVVVDA